MIARLAGTRAAPKGEDAVAQRTGREFLFAIHTALRALKLYPLENQAVQNALTELERRSQRIQEREGATSLSYSGDFCFINDLRLRVDLSSYATFGAVSRTLSRHGIGAVAIDPASGRKAWTAFLAILLEEPDPADPFDAFLAKVEASGLTGFSVEPITEGTAEQSTADAREMARRTYVQSVAVAREVMLGVRMGRGIAARRVKRVVQQMVDQVLNNESSITGMTVLRDYDQYTFAHSVNVCIFSIALGKKLGLTRQQLYELGTGALLHDIGKVALPIELTNKDGPLNEPEWELVREHPAEGLLALLEMAGIGELPLRAMLAAYEHHMKIDLTGYPPVRRPRAPTLYSRIVAIADSFDAATSKRSYQDNPWLPDAVLREMRENPKRGLDPLLVKAFISMTGIYPVGSLVILDTFELAIVIARGKEPGRHHQPLVRVIFDDMGVLITEERVIDLAEVDPETGRPIRAIIKTTDPEKYRIDVKQFV